MKEKSNFKNNSLNNTFFSNNNNNIKALKLLFEKEEVIDRSIKQYFRKRKIESQISLEGIKEDELFNKHLKSTKYKEDKLKEILCDFDLFLGL